MLKTSTLQFRTTRKSWLRRWLRVLPVLLVLIFALSGDQSRVRVSSAQEAPPPTPSPTPDEEEKKLRRAKLRKEIAEADEAEAKARKGEMEATFPSPKTSPLEGKTTIEGAVIESQMLSYVSLARAADRILESIKDNFTSNPNLAVYNERDINLMLSYKVANGQIAIIKQGYTKLLTPTTSVIPCPSPGPSPTPQSTSGMMPPTLPLSAAESFLGAFVDMTALLRTNVDIKGQAFVIDEGPLVAEVFRAARKVAAPHSLGGLYYPYVFLPKLNADQGSTILARLEEIHNLRVTADRLLGDLMKTSKDLGETNSKIKQLNESIAKGVPKKIVEAIVPSGNIIKANCRKLSTDVDGIKSLPPHLQGAAMVKLIEKAHATCRQMEPDKLEQLLGLSDTIGQLGKELEKANHDLTKATTEKKDLECRLRKLESKLALGTIADPTDTDEIKEHAEVAAARLKAINAQFDGLITALTQGEAGGTNPLTNYIRVEKLFSALPVATSYWLLLKVINAGGNNRIKTNPVVDIFTGGNRVSHSGGVIVQYHLFDSDGNSKASGTVSDYTNYIKADKIRELTGSKR